MLKILYIAPDFPNDNRNATHVRANQLLPRLSKQVRLSVFSYSEVTDTYESNTADFDATINRPSTPSLLSLFSMNPSAYSRYAHPKAIEAFINILESHKPDIIHFDMIATFGLFDVIDKAALDYRPKVILQPHDAVSRLYETQKNGGRSALHRIHLRMQRAKITRVEKRLYPKADLCLVDSEEDARLLSSLAKGSNIKVLPLGFDEVEYCPEGSRTSMKQPNVVMTGAMGTIQNIEAATRLCKSIMPIVWETVPEMQVYLAGGRPAPEIMELANDSRVHVTGFVADLASYLRAADVYVCPLRLGSGMRTRAIEALACGCAMVTTPEGVVGIEKSHSSNEYPWLVGHDDTDFASKIIDLHNGHYVTNLKRNAIKTASNYSWHNIAEKLNDYYESL